VTPIVGIDFDNTLVAYDRLIYDAALERGLIDRSVPANKREVRDRIRLLPDGEVEWQKLQGLVYGPLMPRAVAIAGADAFVRECRRRGWRVYVVSHKTEFAGYDETRTNLRDAAREWMQTNGFFDTCRFGLTPGDVFFESTREDKIARIRALGCTHFIDDLEEVFCEPSFPHDTERLLYARPASAPTDARIRVMTDWLALGDYFFGAHA
jgi:hypothetical protein